MSDLDDFTFYKSDPAILVALETSTPLVGTGSLRMYRNLAASGRANGVRATGNRAFTSGRARWLCRVNGFLLGDCIGFAFNQSYVDVTSTGTGYNCYWSISNNASLHTLRLDRMTSGLVTGVNLAASPAFAWAIDTTMALEVSWVVDLVNLGGIRFNVKRGAAPDFSDLVDVANLTNVLVTTNLHTTSMGEGPAWSGGPTNQYSALFDSVSCVPLVVT